jgi:starch phosphorylase
MNDSEGTDAIAETRASDALTELALDLRWSWNHSTHELWGRLDPELWELTQNPWIVLQTVSREQLRKVSADPYFQKRLAELQREKREAEQSQGWFQKTHADSALSIA